MKKVLLTLFLIFIVATSFYKREAATVSDTKTSLKAHAKILSAGNMANSIKITGEEIFSSLSFEGINALNPDVFSKAYLGFNNLKKAGKLPEDSHLLTVCDFSLSSTEKRLWVIDLEEKKYFLIRWLLTEKIQEKNLQRSFPILKVLTRAALDFILPKIHIMAATVIR